MQTERSTGREGVVVVDEGADLGGQIYRALKATIKASLAFCLIYI